LNIDKFRKTVYSYFEAHGRSFPWREDLNPWGIVVSEFMLQQTQTSRVIHYWKHWMERWPSPAALARENLETALKEWSGLGYNRRCRFLLECARAIAEKPGGMVPQSPEELLKLPGIGHYTAGAIACFAYNHPSVFIETNIRSAALHFFFPAKTGIKDEELYPILQKSLDPENPRIWYWALMDYGAGVKKKEANPGRRSAGYVRQSPFEDSFRKLRGQLVRTLAAEGPAGTPELKSRTGLEEEEIYRVLGALEKDGMVAEKEGIYSISG
jgi:A/G-specific adenine glycosylase